MPIRAFSHVAISTPDLDRAVKFWCAHLGFVEVRRWSWNNLEIVDRLAGLPGSAARAVLLAGHGVGVEIFEFDAPPQSADIGRPRLVSDHGFTHVCFEVDDLEADVDRLTLAGMTFWAAPAVDQSGAKLIYGRDPDGNVIELHQHATVSRD